MSTLSWSIETPVAEITFPHRDPLTIIKRLFVVWLVVRTLAWTLLAWMQPNPPLDLVEWVAWGHQWQLGYHKHPPLAAWIAEFSYRLTPNSFLGIYLMGYLAVAMALWCVWRVARQLVPPRAALAATVCLDGLVFLGWSVAEFNNQVILIACWAWAIERFYTAMLFDRPRDWALTGLALGLALCCKYSAFFLIIPLFGWWLWQARPRLWSRPLLVGSVAAVVILPHVGWMVQHDFPTLRYAAARAQGSPDSSTAPLSGIVFLLGQVGRLLPVLLILLPVLRPRWRQLDSEGRQARSLLVVAVVGPVVLHVLCSILFGLQLRDIWGAPLWTFVGLILVLFFQTNDSGRSWRRLRLVWLAVVGSTATLVLAANLYGAALRAKPMRIHYPGQQLAEEVLTRYLQQHGRLPAIVAGDWWLAGNICCQAPHRPMLYGSREPARYGLDLRHEKGDPRRFVSPDSTTCPWTNDKELIRQGGVLVWDASVYGEDMPPWLHERFPTAECQRALHLPFVSGKQKLRVGWAMIRPAGHGVQPEQ